MQQDFASEAVLFPLPPVINIEVIEVIASKLKQLVSSGNATLVLDASQVENITTAGLQLIISLEKTLSSLGRGLVVKDKSEIFRAAACEAGLENLLKGGD